MKKLVAAIVTFFVLTGLWILLTLPVTTPEVITGSAVALVITLLFNTSLIPLSGIKFSFKSVLYVIPFSFVFFAELLKSNIDVAFRVIQPRLPINPGIVKVRTNLKSSLGRLVLAHAITLTPGTLTVETIGDHFYIHWINVSTADMETSTDKIVRKFERYLEVIFG